MEMPHELMKVVQPKTLGIGTSNRTAVTFKEQENLLKFGQGQAVFALESSLDQLNIDRLAYHSGTFVGNHVHEMLTGDGPKKLTEALFLVDINHQKTFEYLFTLLGRIHQKSDDWRQIVTASMSYTEMENFRRMCGFCEESFKLATGAAISVNI
uniref:Uncharacterized protein n=1 Tax=Romanomermis culicivorax TaxID=13658 RepID=A0A915KR01_ROMCU